MSEHTTPATASTVDTRDSELARLLAALKLPEGEGRRRRERAGISRPEFAHFVGERSGRTIHAATLGRWEANRTRPHAANALAWLDALNALDDLTGVAS